MVNMRYKIHLRGGKKMKKSLLILAFAGTMAVAQSAFALTVYDPTNHTEKLATKLEAIKQTAHQAEMVQNELKQLAKLNPAYQDETLMQIRSSISSINDIRNSIDARCTKRLPCKSWCKV